jgi:hypothetical protein
MVLQGWALVFLAAAAGQVVDPEGKPIPGAEACCGEKLTMECVKTDAHGFYRIENPTRRELLVRAKGYIPVKAEAIEESSPIALARAGILTVRIIDAQTGKPVPAGKIILNYTSGQGIGTSAPFNKNGVRITTLVPGEILARAEAPGYKPGGPEVVRVEGGVEKRITIGMRRSVDTATPD